MKKTYSSVPGASLLIIGVILSLSFGCSQEQFKLHESLIEKERQQESDKATKDRVIEGAASDVEECLDTKIDLSEESILPETDDEHKQSVIPDDIEPSISEQPKILLPEVTLGDEELAYLEEQKRKKDIEQVRQEPDFSDLETRIRELQELVHKRDVEGVLYKLTFFTEEEKTKLMSLRSNSGNSLLHVAASAPLEGRAEGLADDPRIVEALCAYTTLDDLNTKGFTALHVSLLDAQQNFEMAKALIRCGASANVKAQPSESDTEAKGMVGVQPIQMIVTNLRSDVFAVAAEKGADLNAVLGPNRVTLLGLLEQVKSKLGSNFQHYAENYEAIKNILTKEGITKTMKAEVFTSLNSIIIKSEKFKASDFEKGRIDIKAITEKLMPSDEEMKALQEKVLENAIKSCKDAGFEVCEVAEAKVFTGDTGTLRSSKNQQEAWIEKKIEAQVAVVGKFNN